MKIRESDRSGVGNVRYEVWRSIDDSEMTYHDSADPSATSYIDRSIFPGSEYSYEIRARSFPFGGPGRCPPGFPEWVNVSFCGRSEVTSVSYQAGADDGFGEHGIGDSDGLGTVPEDLTLNPNYPNPFNPDTTIRFGLPFHEHVRLVIMNVRGEIVQVVVDNEMPAGWHTVSWNGTNEDGQAVASGIYLYLIDTGRQKILRKMTLIR